MLDDDLACERPLSFAVDDAIFLTRRSLEVQPPDQNAWQQHFQVDIGPSLLILQ
jgi:hypothetical protein